MKYGRNFHALIGLIIRYVFIFFIIISLAGSDLRRFDGRTTYHLTNHVNLLIMSHYNYIKLGRKHELNGLGTLYVGLMRLRYQEQHGMMFRNITVLMSRAMDFYDLNSM